MAFSTPFFFKENQLKKWLQGFLKQNSQLKMRTTQGTSHAQAKGFNQENVRKFFELYEPEFRKINSQ
jgi:hypothetical protein